MAIAVNQKVIGKSGEGVITKIITKSTGYVEVTYDNGIVKKEMAFNLTDENGDDLKKKPVKKELTAEQKIKADRRHAAFINSVNTAILKGDYLDCQIKSGNYNKDIIIK